MTDARTPKTSTVLHGWLRGHPFPLATDPEEREAEFWRWLAAHDRETAARAWDEGAEAGYDDAEAGREEKHNPYREGGSRGRQIDPELFAAMDEGPGAPPPSSTAFIADRSARMELLGRLEERLQRRVDP